MGGNLIICNQARTTMWSHVWLVLVQNEALIDYSDLQGSNDIGEEVWGGQDAACDAFVKEFKMRLGDDIDDGALPGPALPLSPPSSHENGFHISLLHSFPGKSGKVV